MLLRNFSTFVLAPLLGLSLSSTVSAAEPQTWLLDPVHTQIVFFADHLGFSHGIGRLKIKQGWFQFDADDWSTARADIVIDMDSLDMGDANWTEKVRGKAFLDTRKSPTAHYIGHSLEKKTANSGILHGELWIRGNRRDVDLDVTFNGAGNDPYAFKTKAGFTATTTLNRFDFGMTSFRDVVAGPVELRIEVEGIRSRRKEIQIHGIEKQ
ncbi:MAG TPA: YceI family protein [Dokdonella sp.]|uniref:YceI family protein n=1 Tax=Dokdonella sp. TaxID=2291710 RepID=UPI002D7F0376|nr:YceI family protein [Dokdonella sp.]HET9031904.1 YceI family protein [Dokdonella sp.]